METIYLLLGSNQGDSLKVLNETIQKLGELGDVISQSSVYKTGAWGKTNQPDFYNQVIDFRSKLEPVALLNELKAIENSLGRIITEKWGPRLIDIDILFYGNITINSSELTIPHSRLHERKFTLIPLNELNPEFIHPVFKKSVKILLAECQDNLTVVKLD